MEILTEKLVDNLWNSCVGCRIETMFFRHCPIQFPMLYLPLFSFYEVLVSRFNSNSLDFIGKIHECYWEAFTGHRWPGFFNNLDAQSLYNSCYEYIYIVYFSNLFEYNLANRNLRIPVVLEHI